MRACLPSEQKEKRAAEAKPHCTKKPVSPKRIQNDGEVGSAAGAVASSYEGSALAAGDEALWLMAIALARDLRKGEDGLDESLRDAFLGAMVAGAVALVAKLCRSRAARLALDDLSLAS